MCDEVRTLPWHDRESKRLTGTRDEESLERGGLLSGPKCGARHTLTFWACLGFVTLFILRVDMSIALVAMATQNSTSKSATDPSDCAGNETSLMPDNKVVTEKERWFVYVRAMALHEGIQPHNNYKTG